MAAAQQSSVLFKMTARGPGIRVASGIFLALESPDSPFLLWKAAMPCTRVFSTCTCSGVKGASVLTAAGVWVKSLVLLAAALQTLFALKAAAVFRVLDEVSGTQGLTDALTTLFIELHVWPAESRFLERRVIFCSSKWILFL